ncbi:deoxynucleoside kinase [Candidatus Eisenbacteria bacterium]|uniref:Deoxynucleoside kinase n=1 Tax=Eiseniibacteriota bacterium TaxID=2212470 RepID=A0ABV6YQB2_UNCEI
MPEPGYIAIEGVIGVGKTTLATLMSDRLGAQLQVEEVEENPFLEKFYGDMRGYAFQTQIFFLLSRYRQQMELTQASLFQQKVVSDYIFAKDRIFAYLNLNDDELALYERLVKILEEDIARPDIVVYLQASTEVLMERIRKRGRPYEKNMPQDYIETLNKAYNHFFFHYDDTPLLMVNTDSLNLHRSESELLKLMAVINTHEKGTLYYRGGAE